MSLLSVTVIGGRNFQKQIKSNEFTDKFCTVKIGDTSHKTVPKYSHQRNVTWGDFLEFNVSKLPANEEITVTAYVKWTITTDFIGEVRLPLADHREVPRRYAHEHWYPFGTGNARLADKPLDNSVGEIGIIIGMFDPSNDEGIHKRQIKDVDDPYYDKVGADEIYMEANEVAKDNKEIVQRMIRVAEQATEKGAETLNVLQVHSEQLEQAEDDVEIIHNQITHGDRKLRGIESCFCCCFTGCCGNDDALKQQLKKQNERAQAADKLRAKEKKDKVEERKELDIARQKNKNREPKGANAAGTPVTEAVKEENTQEKEFAEHVQDINDGLDVLQNHIGNLKEMALKMGEEIEYENERIDNITSNTDQENVRLNKVVQRTKKQI